jgi:periplasmic divalent cation tolerance protein
MSNEPMLVLTTLASVDEARAFVRALVEARLVACGTVLSGATSIYRWEGALTEEPEVVVLLKTDAARWDALAAAVQKQHPYEVPELLALPVARGLPAYLSWLAGEVAA